MKKNTLRAIVDALLFVCLLSSTFIGVLLAFFIGEGRTPKLPKVLWGLHRHDWGDIHLWFSLGMVGLVVIHLILQIPWLRGTSKKLTRLHWILALAILTALSGASLYGFACLKRRVPEPLERIEEHDPSPRSGGRGKARRGGRNRGRNGEMTR